MMLKKDSSQCQVVTIKSQTKNTGEVTKEGTAHYCIIEQSDRCKPIIAKCSKELKEKSVPFT